MTSRKEKARAGKEPLDIQDAGKTYAACKSSHGLTNSDSDGPAQD